VGVSSDVRRDRGLILLALALFTLLVSVSPLLHHDIACHLKTPTHCTACLASPPASRIERTAGPEAWTLQQAERIETLRQDPVDLADVIRTPGRSPPA
jgi:hypothetical protein